MLYSSQQLIPVPLPGLHAIPPRCFHAGTRSRRLGNVTFSISGAVIRAGERLACGIKKKKKIIFPILPVYKILVSQVTETLMFVSLFNLHFTCFLPYLPSGQLWI